MICSYLQVILALILAITSTPGIASESSSATLTPDEKRLQLIEGSMGLSHYPCGNFYKYACSEWHHYKDVYQLENIKTLDYNLQTELENVFGQLYLMTDLKFLREINNYYESCSDIKESYKADTLKYLKWMNVYEGTPWPLVVGRNSSSRQELNWLELLALTRKFGFNELFFHEDVTQRTEDPYKVAIEFERPSLRPLNDFHGQMFGFEDLLKAEEIEKFATFQLDLAKVIVNLVETQEGFSNVLRYADHPDTYEANVTAIKDLQMPWLERYLKALLNLSQLDADMVVYVQSETYLRTVYEFLSKYDNRFLCDYIQIKFLMFLKHNDSYSKRGSCVQSARLQFPLTLQWIHKRRHAELQQDVPLIKEIFRNLKGKFRKTLSTNAYNFTQDIVEHLQGKIDSLRLSVDEILATDLEFYYETLHLSRSDYFGNRLRLNRFHFSKRHNLLSGATLSQKISPLEILHFRPDHCDGNADDRTALYNLPYLFPRFNAIYLPLTMLQYPYYEHDMDDLYKYSSIGFLLGRQITTSFDHVNLQVNGNGIHQNAMYRKMLSNPNFAKTFGKLDKDFKNSNFPMEGAIADLGGLKLAFDTLAELQPKFVHETVTIHNGTITKDKLFFLSYSQNYCSALCGFGVMGTPFYDQCDHVSKPVMHFGKFRHAFQCNIDRMAAPLWR